MATSYRFGEFRLVPATRELWRASAPVAVPPRAYDCIVYLLEHRERAVGRDELIAAVWGRTEAGDGTLGQTILAARRALEDTGKEQHAIRTVFRFGYHWVAPVEVIGDEPSTETPTVSSSATPAQDPAQIGISPERTTLVRFTARRSPVYVFVALAVFVAAVFGWAMVHRSHRTSAPGDSSNAGESGLVVLVLPVTVNAGNGYDWVRLGVMDLIGAELRSAGVPVVPSDNVVALTGAPKNGETPDATALARASGATIVIDARADALEARWRVTLRTAHGRDPPLTEIGEAADVLAAARSAADQLARALGYISPQASAAPTDAPLALRQLSQQIEAALLSDRIDTARALIASATPEQRETPELRLRLAQIDYQAGDFDAAANAFGAVASSTSAEQDPVLHARAVTNLGVIAAMRDDSEHARLRFDEAIDILRNQKSPDALGRALNGRANVAGSEDRYDDALRDFAEARAAFESAGNLLALAVLESNLAAMDMHRFHYAEAEPAFRRAAERFATFGVNAAELNALTAAAELDVALLRPDQALALEPRLAELVDKVADPQRKRAGDLTRAEVFIAAGRLRDAAELLDATTAAAERADDRAATTRGHLLSAQLAAVRGDARAAAAQADTALAHATSADDARERAATARLRIRSLITSGDLELATRALASLQAFAASDGSVPSHFYARLAAADVAAARDDVAAGDSYREALAEADALRIPEDIRDAAEAYAAWQVRTRDFAGAGATAERVAGWAAHDYASALVQLRVQHALGDETLVRAALARALALAGERTVPAELAVGVPQRE
jgi:DNA-binding winged helix-turn-helix (wHTH) protein